MKKKKKFTAYTVDSMRSLADQRQINSRNSILETKEQSAHSKSTLEEGWRKKPSQTKKVSRGADEEME